MAELGDHLIAPTKLKTSTLEMLAEFAGRSPDTFRLGLINAITAEIGQRALAVAPRTESVANTDTGSITALEAAQIPGGASAEPNRQLEKQAAAVDMIATDQQAD